VRRRRGGGYGRRQRVIIRFHGVAKLKLCGRGLVEQLSDDFVANLLLHR